MKIKSFAVIVATCTILCHWDAFGCSEGVFMKKIHLGGKYGSAIGNYALVDDADFDWLNKWKWQASLRTTSNVYATRTVWYGQDKRHSTSVCMHRLLLGVADTNTHVDHIDGNGLNNQRYNIRECTRAENMRNRASAKGSASTYKGVSPHGDKWRVRIAVDGKQRHIGVYGTEKEAAIAYNKEAVRLFGEFARLNNLTQTLL